MCLRYEKILCLYLLLFCGINHVYCITCSLHQDEPYMKPGLSDMKNAIVVPHIASASKVIFFKFSFFEVVTRNLPCLV